MSDDPATLGAREAQERIAQAFAGQEMGPDSPEEGGGEVVSLDGQPTDIEGTDNPFARDAADLEATRRIEALLFASPEPLSEAEVAQRVPNAASRHFERLQKLYATRGVQLRRVADKWQFVTAPDVADVLIEHLTEARKLSRAALETLAIIAYHQPCSRADIEDVRGVAVAKGSLDRLMELGWLCLRGRRDAPGRPVLYGTTPAFLEHFGLDSLSNLPGLNDLTAAGLLDARLPPGFEVPRPVDPDADEDTDRDDGAEGAEFMVSFTDQDGPGDLNEAADHTSEPDMAVPTDEGSTDTDPDQVPE